MRVKARNLGVDHRTTRRGFKRESKNSKTNGGHRWNANAMPGVCKNNVAPPAREPWGPLRRRQTLPLLRAAHFQCCLSHRIRAWFFWRCKKNIASCFIRRALGRLLHNIEKRARRKLKIRQRARCSSHRLPSAARQRYFCKHRYHWFAR